jgi:hypothetical protein
MADKFMQFTRSDEVNDVDLVNGCQHRLKEIMENIKQARIPCS